MACQDREFDGTLWFFNESGSDKVAGDQPDVGEARTVEL